MKYIDEYRNPASLEKMLGAVFDAASCLPGPVRIMEVCGTHTMAAAKMGLRDRLPPSIELLSGPGCPVCVSPASFISDAARCAENTGVIVATFGDMMRVPFSGTSLEEQKGRGADIRVVYSPGDALSIAEENRKKKVVFLGVGFETTAPAVAACVEEASTRGIENFSVLCGHKTMPRAMEALLMDPEARINGFICPGHVSAVIGADPYNFIPEEYKIPCVIAGFEPADILQAVFMLCRQIAAGKPAVEIQYSRAVRPGGNQKAVSAMYRVFEPADSVWRGIGAIPLSGLKFREEFSGFDAAGLFPLDPVPEDEPEGCLCGEILKGKARPRECRLFGRECTPAAPSGACMVSSEGACAANFLYGRE